MNYLRYFNALLFLLFIANAPASANHPVDTKNQQQVSTGKAVYEQNCARCHGVNLRGPRDPSKFPRKLIPPRLDERGHGSHHSDQHMFNQITTGSEDKQGNPILDGMPSYQFRLSDSEIWAVISFIKSNWPDAVQDKQNTINPGHGSGRRGHGHK